MAIHRWLFRPAYVSGADLSIVYECPQNSHRSVPFHQWPHRSIIDRRMDSLRCKFLSWSFLPKKTELIWPGGYFYFFCCCLCIYSSFYASSRSDATRSNSHRPPPETADGAPRWLAAAGGGTYVASRACWRCRAVHANRMICKPSLLVCLVDLLDRSLK